MQQATVISIFFEGKVSQSGYIFPDNKLSLTPRNPNTRYTTKPFHTDAMVTFVKGVETYQRMLSEENDDGHMGDDPILFLDAFRTTFAEEWGPLVKENETHKDFMKCVDTISNVYEAIKAGRMPDISTKVELKWNYTKTNALEPAVDCETLFDAILLSLHLSSQTVKDRSKVCLHYKEYGMRKGCEMTFIPTKSSQMHCSNNCRNIYNQKTKRSRANT